jgi:hypothetical protein
VANEVVLHDNFDDSPLLHILALQEVKQLEQRKNLAKSQKAEGVHQYHRLMLP